MKKAFLIAGCSLISVFAVAGFAACGEDETYNVTVNEAISVILDEGESLDAKVEGSAIKGITYKTSNPAIATVNEYGIVTGVGCGETTVTATYKGNSATATVTVELGDNVPMLVFDGVSGTDLQVSWMDEIEFSPVIIYKGKTFDDVTVSYEVDETAATVVNGVFKAKKSGECTVVATASWRNVPIALTETFTIKAIPSVEISINKGLLNGTTLYTAEELAGEKFAKSIDLDCVVKVDGVATNDYEIVVIEGTESVSVEGGVLTAKKLGDATLRVSVVDPLGATHSEYASVSVKRPLASVAKTAETPFDAMTGTFDTEEVFGYQTTVVEAYENGEKLTVADGKIQGITVKGDGSNIQRTLTVYDETGGYNVNFKAYTKVIRTAQDFDIFNDDKGFTKETDKYRYDGYYVLGNDIDAKDYATVNRQNLQANDTTHTHNLSSGTSQWKRESGLRGTFDGQGYTVSNLTVQGGGIFGVIGQGGIVKNVGFTNVTMSSSSWSKTAHVLAMYIFDQAVIENVYIQVGAIPSGGGNHGVLAYKLNNRANLNNVVIDTGAATGTNCVAFSGLSRNEASLTAYGTSGTPMAENWENTYLLTNLSVETGNVYKLCVQNETPAENSCYAVGLFKYATVDAWKAAQTDDATKNDFSSFSTDYWDLTSGVPVWKN